MTMTFNEMKTSPHDWRYQLAGLFLALSILFASSHIYASEICFILFFLLCFLKLKFNFLLAFIGLSCLCLFIFFSIGSDRTLNEMVFVILLSSLPCLGISQYRVNIDSLVEGISLGLTISAIYGFLLLFVQIIFPGIAQNFEPCLYSAERTINSCGIPPYVIGDFSLQRLYGLASEPSTYGMTHVVLLSLLISNPRLNLSSGFVVMQIMSILATISITAIALLTMMFSIMSLRRTKLVLENKKTTKRKNFKTIIIIIAVSVILAVLIDGIVEALLNRTYGRIVDLFSGEDISAFMRSTATWLPALSFFSNGSISEVLFGVGVNQYLLFLEGFSTFTIVDGTLLEIRGQRGSILSILLGGFGLVTLVAFITMLFLIDRYRFSVVALCVFGFLFFHTTALSFSTLALIYVIGINGANISNVK